MYAFHAPALSVESVARLAVRRVLPDHGPRVQDGNRARTWRERLNRAAFAARSRVTFRAPELEHRAALEARRIRCEVYAERNGFNGRAVFWGAL